MILLTIFCNIAGHCSLGNDVTGQGKCRCNKISAWLGNDFGSTSLREVMVQGSIQNNCNLRVGNEMNQKLSMTCLSMHDKRFS